MTSYTDRIRAMSSVLAPVLKPGLDPARYAAGLLDDDENETGHYEVTRADTRDGVPFTFTAEDCGLSGPYRFGAEA
jgi:hypothetical protein